MELFRFYFLVHYNQHGLQQGKLTFFEHSLVELLSYLFSMVYASFYINLHMFYIIVDIVWLMIV